MVFGRLIYICRNKTQEANIKCLPIGMISLLLKAVFSLPRKLQV